MPRGRKPPAPPAPPVDPRYPHRGGGRGVIFNEGELLVTGQGHATIDQPLRRSRALLIRSEEAVEVCFSPDDPPVPPCAGGQPDELRWEVIEQRRELYLKIHWRVNSARTILWKVYEVR